MSNRTETMERFNIISRANSFLKSKNFKIFDKIIENNPNTNIFNNFFITELDVAPITISQLETLYFYTIYISEGTFDIIDYLIEFNTNVICTWIDTKISFSADEIENQCKEKVKSGNGSDNIGSVESDFISKWIKRQKTPIDSDLLALRTLETLILLSILRFQSSTTKEKDFKELEGKLMDWSEAVGLIRSLSDENRFSLADTSMDVDFNPNADASQTSTILSVKPGDFEIYLLEKFKGLQKIKEIVEIVAERCGIPVDSDFEDEKEPSKQPSNKEQSKHWRRVKPVTLPVKRVTSSTVNRPSSLSVSELKSTRFVSTSSRQVDLALKPPSSVLETKIRRHSEASASLILQQTTPTKTRKTSQSSSMTTNLSDSIVILETPPRVLSKQQQQQVHQNDLTSSVRRLFSPQQQQQQMEE